MGCFCSKQKQFDEDPAPNLAAQTHFTVKDVRALHELFRKLSTSIVDDNFINREEFHLGMFENRKGQSFFADKIFDMFDSNKDGVIEFGEFVRSLSIFHPDAPQSEKAIFAYQLYDIWQTGFIEREEVKLMILTFLDESDLVLSDDIVGTIIDKTFEQADVKGDGIIDTEEWNDFVAQNPSILKNMTIPYLRDLSTEFPSFILRAELEDDETNNAFDNSNTHLY